MLTVRTDWNRNNAILIKSFLENYEVQCVLGHEYANLLYPFAMPIRLLVADDQVDRAMAILTGDFDRAAEIETAEAAGETVAGSISPKQLDDRNPWELLVIAFYIFLPAACVLQTKYPVFVKFTWQIRREIAAVTVFHFIGWLEAIVAAVLVVTYVRLWRSS
jgi:hypothetical protein